jgi:glycosidase
VRRSARAAAPLAAAALALAGSAASSSPSPAPAPAPPRGAALAELARPPVLPPLAAQRIYFVMPDRYANGDPSNDRGGLDGPRELTGYDPADTGFFHGGDYRGLTGDCTGPRGLARIRDLGFTTIWVTPPFRQKYVQGESAGYHGYWALGLDQVDPHLGSEADFAAFVACARSLGLKVILDVVVNHTADVIRLPSNAYGPPKPPSVPPEEATSKSPAWLNDPSNYHNRGDIDFNSCSQACFELGDFFGLDDLATEQADVRDGLARVFGDWIRRYRIDGFRIDTARHVERGFFGAWVPRIEAAAREAGVEGFQLFGEAFLTDAIELSAYVRDRGLPNVLDFPLQDAIARFAGGSAGSAGVATRLADDDYFARSDGVVHVPPTFVGNHDIGRAAMQVRDKGLGGERLLERTRLAYDLLYLLRGAPVVYYGDELGIVGRGGDREARHDLFPTAVAEWREQERVGAAPIGSRSYFDEPSHPLAERMRALAALRDAHPALATGATVVRQSGRNALVVSRIDTRTRREYVVAFNASARPVAVDVPTAATGEFEPLFGGLARVGDEPLVARRDGKLSFRIAPLSPAVLVAKSPVAPRRPAKPRLAVGRDPLSDLVRVRAVTAGTPASVSFAVRRAGAARWTRLAADGSPPYRAFLDPARFRRGERVHLVAIARGLDGRLAVSAVRSHVPRR